MRKVFMALFATVTAWSANAQQLSPLTGTTASPPPVTGPAAAPTPNRPARPPRMRFRDRFEAANTTHDGKLTLDQAQAGRMPQVVDHFAAIDAQHRGYVTMEDIRAYRRAMREQRKAQPR